MPLARCGPEHECSDGAISTHNRFGDEVVAAKAIVEVCLSSTDASAP